MQKMVRDETISLIKAYLPEIGVQIPLRDEEDVGKICEYFEDMEVSLANALGEGDKIDRDLLDAAANAFDDLAIIEDDEYHDIEDLNRRLMA
ncbi:MAG: hypothetical protein IKR86_09775 [Candidatus Methanomethylophilaceae archaeon]|nr:hypothetical protein [Candidatus Methanomethylophilaceae archaeon]